MPPTAYSPPLCRSLVPLRIEFSSNYSQACGNVVLYDGSASQPRSAVPRSRLFAAASRIGTGGSSSLTVKPAQLAVFTDGHKGTALSLATAGAAASFSFMTRDEFFNMRSDQSVRADCAADADCTLSVRIVPSAPQASLSNRAKSGTIALHSVNNFFDVAYTLTAAGVYSLAVAAVHRLPSGESTTEPRVVFSIARCLALLIAQWLYSLLIRHLLGGSRRNVLQRCRHERAGFF